MIKIITPGSRYCGVSTIHSLKSRSVIFRSLNINILIAEDTKVFDAFLSFVGKFSPTQPDLNPRVTNDFSPKMITVLTRSDPPVPTTPAAGVMLYRKPSYIHPDSGREVKI